MEEIRERGFGGTGDRTVCLDCIFDEGLREEVAPHLTEGACTFCGREAVDEVSIAADFDVLMRPVMDAIRFFYCRSIDTLFVDDDVTSRYSSWEVAGEVCEGAVADNVLEAISEVITPDEWNDDPGMMRPNVALRYAWHHFREKVKHKARFVFLSIPEEHSDHPDDFTTRELLGELIDIIQTLGVITEVPAGRTFYRGRMIDEPEAANYDASTLGSPPPAKASANRMSPAGISMFYGCDDVATVVAEIGSHTTRRFAIVGAFETIRPLRMVNLADLPPRPSVFVPEQQQNYYESVFLGEFARDLSEPVLLDGREHIDYVPTQVVTEYIRWLPEVAIDGIQFTSAQNGGTSCVIFCGPEGCADAGKETDETMLRLKDNSLQTVRVVASPAAP